jgi:hypothetical protein
MGVATLGGIRMVDEVEHGHIYSQRAETFTDYVCCQFSSGRSDSYCRFYPGHRLDGKIKNTLCQACFFGIYIMELLWRAAPHLLYANLLSLSKEEE